MHLGTGLIRGSHPLGVAGLVERHPRTRFLLMHLAYPWSRDLLGMAFVYRNIWLDLTWSFLLSPSHFKLALHEAIEVLPNESRMMLGGDNWHVDIVCHVDICGGGPTSPAYRAAHEPQREPNFHIMCLDRHTM